MKMLIVGIIASLSGAAYTCEPYNRNICQKLDLMATEAYTAKGVKACSLAGDSESRRSRKGKVEVELQDDSLSLNITEEQKKELARLEFEKKKLELEDEINSLKYWNEKRKKERGQEKDTIPFKTY